MSQDVQPQHIDMGVMLLLIATRPSSSLRLCARELYL